jgi:hypothetical protein
VAQNLTVKVATLLQRQYDFQWFPLVGLNAFPAMAGGVLLKGGEDLWHNHLNFLQFLSTRPLTML